MTVPGMSSLFDERTTAITYSVAPSDVSAQRSMAIRPPSPGNIHTPSILCSAVWLIRAVTASYVMSPATAMASPEAGVAAVSAVIERSRGFMWRSYFFSVNVANL